MSTDTIDRELSLEGSANFRDLGGLRTGDGGAVRAGRLFRSDALHGLTAADLERIAHLAIRTLIDLRSPAEIAASGPSPLLDRGARHLHWPIFSRDVTKEEFTPTDSLGELYATMLERGTERLGLLFETLAEADSLPAVIHCAAGKDRTGVVSAIVLRTLGVPDTTIVADYAVTDRNMARLVAQQQAAGRPISDVRVPEHFMRAVPETMETFLATLDARHGSIAGYLAHAGIRDEVIAAVRNQLLEPAG